MDLTPYIHGLQDGIARAADSGDDESRAIAERLAAPMESEIRLALLAALSAAAAEITRELAPGSVEVRLRGTDPEFVVNAAATIPTEADSDTARQSWLPAEGEDATMTRINLRLPQDLKDRVESSARHAGLSVNAWLVRAAAAALGGGEATAVASRSRPRGGDRYTGWVR